MRFRLSGAKDLCVIALLNEKIKVITAYLIEKRWQDKIGWFTWQKK